MEHIRSFTAKSRHVWVIRAIFIAGFIQPSRAQEMSKLDPTLKTLLAQPALVTTPIYKPFARISQSDTTIDILIRTTNGVGNWAVPGMTIKSITGNIVVASVPLNQLQGVDQLQHNNILSIHAPKVWRPTLNISAPTVQGITTRNADNIKGNNVIVGIIDTGIDPLHMDFRVPGENNRTRILSYWDMTESSADFLPPEGFESSNGTEMDSTDINLILRTTEAFLTNKDENGHGTHVSGMAAGNGGETPFIGIAPEADLIVVNATRDNVSFSSADVITAMNYIDARARALGKPYVINLSLGAIGGPTDGTDVEGQAIDALVGTGKPGKAVVVAAGNDGGRRLHARGVLSEDPTIPIVKRFSASAGDIVIVDLWSSIKPNDIDKIFITVTGPDGTFFGPATGFPGLAKDTRDGTIRITSSAHPHVLTGSDINSTIGITVKNTGTWTLSIRGEKGEGSGTIDMWTRGTGRSGLSIFVPFFEGEGDDAFMVGHPGSTKNAITVGSFVTRDGYESVVGFVQPTGLTLNAISGFSSPGPNRDGTQKPDISAPGEKIGAALSADSPVSSLSILPGGSHTVKSGTSMAAPHVTGAVALAFAEATKRGLFIDAQQIKDAMTKSAAADFLTGSVPNVKWGAGRLDMDGFFKELFGDPLSVQISTIAVQAEGRRIRLNWNVFDNKKHTGFHIYRSRTAQSTDRVRITEELLVGGPALSFIDTPPSGGTLYYWVADVDANGRSTFHGPVPVTIAVAPSAFQLIQNKPNPFNPTTTIEYDLPRRAHVTIRVYDTLGREVRTLLDATQPAGFHQIAWNGRDLHGKAVSSGVYLYTMTAGSFVESKKMLLLK